MNFISAHFFFYCCEYLLHHSTFGITLHATTHGPRREMPLFREFSLKVDILPRDIIGNFKFSSLSHPLMNETERWISQGTHSQRSIGGACEMIISSSSLSLVVMPTFRFPKGPYVINAKGLEGQEEDDDEDDSFLSTTTTHHHFLNTPLSNTRHTSLRSQTMVHQLFFSWRKKTRAVFF